MQDSESGEDTRLTFSGIAEFVRAAARKVRPLSGEISDQKLSYRLALGREPIQLGIIEFRILIFLASSPYQAFSRRRIAAAVNSQRFPVTEETVDQHVHSLQDQLGFFCDYVQAVPYIGYRFKA